MPPHHDHGRRIVSGAVEHLFAHRFTIRTPEGVLLADLTPHGRDAIALAPGDEVTIEGEMKPSELKVSRITRGATVIEIAHKPKHEKHGHGKDHDHTHAPASPDAAIAAAKAEGYEMLGEPRCKPKHFEIRGRKAGKLAELHVELDGHIRKTKPVLDDDSKWASALS